MEPRESQRSSPSLLEALQRSVGLTAAARLTDALAQLTQRMATPARFREIQDALLFLADSSAAHRIATLRFCASRPPLMDVSYIGTGKYIRQCVATGNVQRPFEDMFAAAPLEETLVCEASVHESAEPPQESTESVLSACLGWRGFFAPNECASLLALLFASLDAADLELKAALVRDFPHLYLQLEKVLLSSRMSFGKDHPPPARSAGIARPRLIEMKLPVDLTRLGESYPELAFYLRYFLDNSGLDLLSVDRKRRMLGLAWNYRESCVELTCVKRGDCLVWHDPEHMRESLVVAQMKAELGQTVGELVGDDVRTGPGMVFLARASLRLRALGLLGVSFSSITLAVELEDLSEAALLFSLRMGRFEGVVGSTSRLMSVERDIVESFRLRFGVVSLAPPNASAILEEDSRTSMFGLRLSVSSKQSSVMAWLYSFCLGWLVRGRVVAELLALGGELLRALAADLAVHAAPSSLSPSSTAPSRRASLASQETSNEPCAVPPVSVLNAEASPGEAVIDDGAVGEALTETAAVSADSIAEPSQPSAEAEGSSGDARGAEERTDAEPIEEPVSTVEEAGLLGSPLAEEERTDAEPIGSASPEPVSAVENAGLLGSPLADIGAFIASMERAISE